MQEGRTLMVGMTSVGLLSAWLRAYAVGGERYERFKTAAENPGYLLGEALDASGFFALPIEAAATTDTMMGFNPVKDPSWRCSPMRHRAARACAASASILSASCSAPRLA